MTTSQAIVVAAALFCANSIFLHFFAWFVVFRWQERWKERWKEQHFPWRSAMLPPVPPLENDKEKS